MSIIMYYNFFKETGIYYMSVSLKTHVLICSK